MKVLIKKTIAALGLATLASCNMDANTINTALNVATALDTSQERQVRVGSSLANDVLRGSRRSGDKALENKLQRMVDQIAARNGLSQDFSWKVYLLASRNPNAMTGGGGHLFVEEGLVGLAPTEAAMAMVLAHEMAHVTEAHTVKAIRNNALLSTVLGQVAGRSGVNPTAVGLGASAVNSQFSQGAERSADNIGFRYFVKAGYAPREAGQIFRILDKEVGSASGIELIFAASHPTNSSRVDALTRQMNALPSDVRNGGVRDTAEWRRLAAKYRNR